MTAKDELCDNCHTMLDTIGAHDCISAKGFLWCDKRCFNEWMLEQECSYCSKVFSEYNPECPTHMHASLSKL